MTVLVAGASGFIGSNISSHLKSIGYRVLGASRSEGEIKGDLAKTETLSIQLEGIDALAHFAGDASVRRFIEDPSMFSQSVNITKNLLEFSRVNDVKTFVFASSDRVYGSAKGKTAESSDVVPRELYAASKIAGEALCRAYYYLYGINFVILRIANVYGPGQKHDLFIPSAIKQAISGSEVKVGNINVHRNFVYVKDVCSACSTTLKNKKAKNNVFNVGESNANLKDVINLISKIKEKHTGSSLTVIQDKSRFRPQSTEIGKFILDCRKARSIGWRPKYTLERGVEETFLYELRGDKN